MLAYPVKLTKDTNATWLVTVPDLPEAVTYGGDLEEALARARDVIEDCLGEYVVRRRALPAPSRMRRGLRAVTISPRVEMKLALYDAMRQQGVGKAELARRLNCHLPQIDRLLDLRHGSRIDQLDAAFAVLGKRLSIQITDAA